MLRRLNLRVTSCIALKHEAAIVPSLMTGTQLFHKGQLQLCTEVKETTSFCQQQRCFHTQPVCHMRVAGSIKPQTSPMNFDGSSSGSGNTADSLTPYVREHLFKVYGLLAAGCVAAGFGSVLMFATPLCKTVPFWLPMAAGFVPLLWLSFAPPQNPNLKMGLFFAFTVLEGMALAPLIASSMAKGVLGTAIVLTGAVFCGFSAGAYLAPRASLLALQGPLFGMLLGMVAISVLNLFYPTAFVHSIILYGGLALFSVMVSVDTQAMIERARCGAGDVVQDALQMFMNVVNIFVRIAQILGSGDR
ncbi:Inhibitor of apoptosis-promoting Bax1, putative [Trypanosoma equiperdum]|uniref:Inhibitor of apoptosis-promoting Bax1 n=2 Tax=Trypanozoon TaxID=39700 RepID=Q385I6_TRYB2|nr:hypothetical protein, conserved [Trypanosoma brucei brucei TREU927]EAN79545.1 hypothetical protein, conserved [Trypanosoma brucei brucei TREU927]SCU66329.1 Inhibitor of apoptosis-promoting Bax1, putative [Trypanosoma equiperdum]